MTNNTVKKLQEVERDKVRNFVRAQELFINHLDELSDTSTEFLLQFLRSNTTVPVLLVGENGEYINSMNVPIRFVRDSTLLQKKIASMRSFREPIVLQTLDESQYVFFENSSLLKRLRLYPYILVGILFLFAIFTLWYYNITKENEQTLLWVGLAKETAHQIGTPLSSLMGWLEILKMEGVDRNVTDELEKDITRLNTIAQRFSKIGSAGELKRTNIVELTQKSLDYLKNRISKKVDISFQAEGKEIYLDLNASLYSWVIENLIKNSVDAMNSSGEIIVEIFQTSKTIEVNIKDTGTGITSKRFEDIFRPGFTSKKRGWGLGLSLARRIIKDYHGGNIYVAQSTPDKGTEMKIVLLKKF